MYLHNRLEVHGDDQGPKHIKIGHFCKRKRNYDWLLVKQQTHLFDLIFNTSSFTLFN